MPASTLTNTAAERQTASTTHTPVASTFMYDDPTVSKRALWLTVAGLVLSLLLAALDQTIVGTAMPRVVAELRGFEHYAWVTTAYLVTSTTVVPIVGRLSDLYGRRRFLLGGVAFFLLASMLCGLAQDMTQLIVFRGLQGIGGGILTATIFAAISTLFPPAQRARFQGAFGAVFGLASIVGPLIGGYLTDSLSWRWVFYVNLPVGLIALAVLWLYFRDHGERRPHKGIDYLGSLTLVLTVVPLLLALSWGGRQYAWLSPQILGLLAFSAVMLAAFLWAEGRSPEPILPLSLFRNDIVAVCALGIAIIGVGMFGTILFIPLFIQAVMGASATQSGTALMPMMLGMIASSMLGGQIIARTGRYKLLAVGGLALSTLGMLLLAGMGPDTDSFTIARNMVVVGVGMGPTMPVFTLATQSAVRLDQLGIATSVSQFSRSIGGTVGSAMFGGLLAARFGPALREAMPPAMIAGLSPGQVAQIENPQALLNPEAASVLQAGFAQLGPQGQQVYETFMAASRIALASTLREVFLAGAVIVGLGAVVVACLREVPLRGGRPTPGAAPKDGSGVSQGTASFAP